MLPGRIDRRRSAAPGSAALLALIFALCGAAGCEAPLNLQTVEQRRSEPVRRPDQFQAAAGNGAVIAVVGNQGLVVTSTDGGGTWRREQLPDWPMLIDITACPDGAFAALAVESQVWISTDGGAHWRPHPIESEEAPQAITCDPQGGLWVVGSFSSIFHSTDRGRRWEVQSLDEDLILTNIQFLDSENAFITGEFGTVLKSGDGGRSWERLPALENEFYPQTMLFTDPQTGWIAGLGGEVLHTADGAETWTKQETDTIAPLYGIGQVDDDMYIVGGEGNLLRLVEGRWFRLDHGRPIRLYLRAILATGEGGLLVAGRAGALYVLPVSGLKAVGIASLNPPYGLQLDAR